MPSSRVCANPAPHATAPSLETDPALTTRYREDAAHFPGGFAPAVIRPRSVGELAACLRDSRRVLAVGAQSSLTGGATPMGETVISTERLTDIEVTRDRVVAGAGATLQSIQDALARHGRWFPPAPTYLGATAGGAVATCAAGAATFKYGAVREWVDAISVVLAGGDVLGLSRGQVMASADGAFEIDTASGVRRVHVPPIRVPDVPKRSAGYFAAPGMDLIDLFIGSEGTLGVVARVVLRTAPKPAVCRWLVPIESEPKAIALVDELRRESHTTWASRDQHGIDIAAIEHIDARSLALLREDGIDRRLKLALAQGTGVILLIDLELSEDAVRRDLWAEVATARDANVSDSPIVRLCRALDRHRVLDNTEVALPTDLTRVAAFAELREAVPAAVNRRVALAREQIDSRISKIAADMIVPFDRFADMMSACRRIFEARGLDLAVWGHISDGNVHPNVIPRAAGDMASGRDAILALGREVIDMGGCPLAEHGVGRNSTKQSLLTLLYGDAGVAAMRRVKQALDPDGRLAPGVIFPTE